MFEEASSSLPSIWASMNSWFTPTLLFIFLNLMICTIAITSSSITTQKHQINGPQTHQPQPLSTSSSMLSSYAPQQPISVLENPPESYSHFDFRRPKEREEQPQVDRSPPVLRRTNSFNVDDYIALDSDQSKVPSPTLRSTDEEMIHYDFEQSGTVEHHSRYTKPSGGEIPSRLQRKMKKSASSKSAFSHFVEEDIVEARRPDTVKERKPKPMEVDEEVDAKADDFINKFKHQLKLQRIDSIIRYKQMLSRGNEKVNLQSLG